MKRVAELELEEDLAFERRSSRWQRGAQVGFVFLVAAALAGVFGSGPVARAVAADPTGELKVEYSRFSRRLAPCEFVFEVGPQLRRGGDLQLWFNHTFADRFQWEGAAPEPAEMELQDGRLLARFRLQPGAEPARIICRLKPGRMGAGRIETGVVDGPQVAFGFFVYP